MPPRLYCQLHLTSLACIRARARSDLEEDELGVLDETSTYIKTPYDATSASAPYYWNKTCIPTATANFRIHDESLSAVEVGQKLVGSGKAANCRYCMLGCESRSMTYRDVLGATGRCGVCERL